MTVTRSGLRENGWSDFQIRRSRRDSRLISVIPGWYRTSNDTTDDAEIRAEQSWNDIAQVLLDRGGPSAVVSHRAAAGIHQFDLFTDSPRPRPEVTVPYGSTFHPSGGRVHRTRNLDEYDVTTDVTRRGFRVTSKARTVLDLSRSLSTDDLEIVVESALRSPVPTDPAAWDESTLHRLEKFARLNHPGTGKLRTVLGQRPPGCRPTGSIYETRGLQALRTVGLGNMDRQHTLTVIDDESGEAKTVFPDVGEYNVGVTIEFDSHSYHKDRREAERKRDNHIGKVVRVLRFDHSLPLPEVARQVRRAVDQAAQQLWPQPDWQITREPNRMVIRIPRP
jgi:hypothetical protein